MTEANQEKPVQGVEIEKADRLLKSIDKPAMKSKSHMLAFVAMVLTLGSIAVMGILLCTAVLLGQHVPFGPAAAFVASFTTPAAVFGGTAAYHRKADSGARLGAVKKA